MTLAAALTGARAALATLNPTYYRKQLTTDPASGQLEPPDDARYYVLDDVADPATHDLDAEAYARLELQVDCWALSFGAEYGMADAASAALALLGFERRNTFSLGRDGGYTGCALELTLIH